MEDKTKIIERLLEKGHITAEEAVVLLTKEVQYVYSQVYPWYPYNPYVPPYVITCSSSNSMPITIGGPYSSTASN